MCMCSLIVPPHPGTHSELFSPAALFRKGMSRPKNSVLIGRMSRSYTEEAMVIDSGYP